MSEVIAVIFAELYATFVPLLGAVTAPCVTFVAVTLDTLKVLFP